MGVMENSVCLGVSEGTLNFVGVDDSADIWIGDFSIRKSVSLLLLRSLGLSSEDFV